MIWDGNQLFFPELPWPPLEARGEATSILKRKTKFTKVNGKT